MTEQGHAPFVVLLDLVEAGRSGAASVVERARDSSAVAAEWSAHIANCAKCQARMREVEQVIDAITSGDAGGAPESWIRRAEARSLPSSYLTPLRGGFVAELVFDSAAELAAGVRSGTLEGRQLVFAWQHLEMELTVAPAHAAGSWSVSGQIFSQAGPETRLGDCHAVLVEGEAERERVAVTPSGEFLFTVRPAAAFGVRIEGEGWTLETPAFER